MAEPHVAGDEALGCGTLCLQSSPALFAHPLLTILGGPKVPPSLVGSAHLMALAATSREQLQPRQLGKGDGCPWRHSGGDGALGKGHSWSRCAPERPRRPVSAFNEWERERFTVIPVITLFILGSRGRLVSSTTGSR